MSGVASVPARPALAPLRRLASAAALLALAACARMPTAGPHGDDVVATASAPGARGVQIVAIDGTVAGRLREKVRARSFADALDTTDAAAAASVIGPGDTVEVTLWEAPPATLFGAGPVDPRAPSTARSLTLPEQLVDREGSIRVPFAGNIRAAGRSPQQVQAEIVSRLAGKAHRPEALVRIVRNGSSAVTVVGEVAQSLRLPLTPAGERLLDALAAAGGVRQPVHRTTVQLTRGGAFHAMPLDEVIRDPRQNVPLRSGDVVTAVSQPLALTVLGATGRNEELQFESQGITLAQALARAGGLNDARSDPQGVFVFRFERADALDWPLRPVATTPDGRVPVVYRLDLSRAGSFFLMQQFPMEDRDVLYVSNAPAAELQKFLNLVFTVAYPVLNTIQVVR
jgi:polysaccharide export outer membrane protein